MKEATKIYVYDPQAFDNFGVAIVREGQETVTFKGLEALHWLLAQIDENIKWVKEV